MINKVIKFWVFGLISIFLVNLGTENSFAQQSTKNKQLRTNTSLFRTTPSEQIALQESTLLEQAIQDKIENEFDDNDQYDQEFKWAAEMKERGYLDDEQIRSIAKNRAANRARKSFEAMIKGSEIEKGYRKLERGIKSFKDYSTVEIGKKANGEITAHKLDKNKDTTKEESVAVFYLQPDLNNGISAVIDTKKNIRMEYQPTDNRLIVGYQIHF